MIISNTRFNSKHLLTIALAMTSSQNMCANDSNSEYAGLTLGAGSSYKTPIYIDSTAKANFYPSIDAYWGPLFFTDYKIGSYLAGKDNWALSIRYGLDNRESISRGGSTSLNNMQNLNNVYAVAIKGESHHDLGNFNITVATDASNEHQGKIIDLGYSYRWKFNQHSINFELISSWMSQQVTQYYYGIQVEDETENRPAYFPSDAINWSYEVDYDYSLSANEFLYASIVVNTLSNEIKNSPIVNKANRHHLLLGFIYTF